MTFAPDETLVRVHPVISYKTKNFKAYQKLCENLTWEVDNLDDDEDSDLSETATEMSYDKEDLCESKRRMKCL